MRKMDNTIHKSTHRVQRVVSGGLLCLIAVGCGSDTTDPSPQDIATVYWALHLNQHAITMALPTPYNMVQLTAAPVTLAGTPVPEAGSIQYSTHDSTIAVDSLGRVTARYATLGQLAQVVARLTVDGVTLADTAFVQVDSFPLAHPLTTFSIHPYGTTCRNSAFNSSFTLPVYAIDAAGDTVRNASVVNIPVYYTSSDRTIATIDRSYGYVSGNGPGAVTFTATALIDGVTRQDTLAYILGPSHDDTVITNMHYGAGNAAPTMTFSPSAITVGAGWRIFFVNPTVDSVDVVFTDSTRGANGIVVGFPTVDQNHNPIIQPGSLLEVFFDAGTYDFHSDRFGQNGAIRVQCGYEHD